MDFGWCSSDPGSIILFFYCLLSSILLYLASKSRSAVYLFTVFAFWRENYVVCQFRKEMGRFKKHCSNVLHSTWCQQSENVSVKVPAYRYLQAFKKMASDAGFKSHKVRYVCDKCIEKAQLKKEFCKFLSTTKIENDSFAEVPEFHS